MQDELNNAIATDLGIADLPKEEQQKLITQFGEVALKAASVAVLEKLSEDKRSEVATLIQSGNPEDLKVFLDREVPGHEQIAQAAVQAEVTAFKAAITA